MVAADSGLAGVDDGTTMTMRGPKTVFISTG